MFLIAVQRARAGVVERLFLFGGRPRGMRVLFWFFQSMMASRIRTIDARTANSVLFPFTSSNFFCDPFARNERSWR